jgi:hypothetical protein
VVTIPLANPFVISVNVEVLVVAITKGNDNRKSKYKESLDNFDGGEWA